MTSRSMSATPSPAVPAPWITTRWSRMRPPAARTAEKAAASTTAAVPCMSSLDAPQGVREQLGRGLDVGVDEIVVALVSDPGVLVAQVHLVVEQGQVVGAHVQHHRDHPAGMDPGGRGVDGQLADGDVDPADALVPDAEDALGVGGHDEVHVVGAEAVVPKGGLDVLWLVDRQVDAAGSPVFVAVALDGLAEGGGGGE